MNRPCPLCSSLKKVVLHSHSMELPDEYHLSKDFQIVTCEECGMVFQDFDQTKSDYDYYYTHSNMYSGVQPSEQSKKVFRYTADLIKKNCTKVRRILDIGAGLGSILLILKNEGYENLYALDPSEASVAQLKKQGLNTIKGSAYELIDDLRGSFDLVISTTCLEHFCQPSEAVENMILYLKPEGLLLISVPDVSLLTTSQIPFNMVFNHEHINQFSRETMKSLMGIFSYEERDFKQLSIQYDSESFYFGVFSKNENSNIPLIKQSETARIVENFIEKEVEHYEKCYKIIDDFVENQVPLVIWGAGTMMTNFAKNTPLLEGNVLAIIDNNPTKSNKTFCGIPIHRAEFLDTLQCTFHILICINGLGDVKKIEEDIIKNHGGAKTTHFLKE